MADAGKQEPQDRLADEREHATSGLGLGAMLVLVVVLVFGVNAFAIRKSPWRLRTFDGHIVHTKWDLASQGAPDGGIVAVGDSSGNFAVVGSVLEDELGLPARNLCTYGRFLAMGAGWFLDRALSSGDGVPRVVLVVLGSRTFALEADGFTMAQVPKELGSWGASVPGVSLTFEQGAQAAVARVFPLFAQNKSFQRAIRKGMWKMPLERMQIDPDGSAILPLVYPPGVAPFADKTIDEMKAVLGSVPSDVDRRAIVGLIADAEERGYDVVFVDGPVWSGLAARDEHVTFLGQVHSFLDGACEASARAWHLPGPLQTFEAEVMENPFHINRNSALVYTRELAARLRALGVVD